MEELVEIIEAYGHPNITSTHPTTFQITKDSFLTKRGDCIIAIRASKGASDLSPEIKNALRKGLKIVIEIEAGGLTESVSAYGSEKLMLTHKSDLVVRKSDFICERTLAIKADKAAADFSRKFVENLKNENQKIIIKLRIKPNKSFREALFSFFL